MISNKPVTHEVCPGISAPERGINCNINNTLLCSKAENDSGFWEFFNNYSQINKISGTKDFFVNIKILKQFIQYSCTNSVNIQLSINRRQVGKSKYIHRLKLYGLGFSAVSYKPLMIV